ncbi:hypothetical protein [Halomarina rubra]|uniref:Big-1 domain-containing protein n=1 Tax=Halomarina rubra TaxID=2071873 RepID=A0ABD6ARA1_9EURY|nr:hypothetical protein [Halomarina rubra]
MTLSKHITQGLSDYWNDERGVSPVVGFVLIFGIIVIALALYQSQLVPAQNEQVEFKHSQVVETEMNELQGAISAVSSDGSPRSVSLDLAPEYPDRAVAVNPGQPIASLRTTDPATVTLSGLSSADGQYWDGTDKTFDTRMLEYQSNYNVYSQDPIIRFENGMVTKEFDNGESLVHSDGSVVSDDGNQIDITFVNGTYQESVTTAGVTAKPVSTSREFLQLRTAPGGGAITLPTTLSQERWDALLDGVGHVSAAVAGDTVTLDLEGDRLYTVRLTEVTFSDTPKRTVHYLASEEPRDPTTNLTVEIGQSIPLTVSTRDRLGNTKAGATVEANISGPNANFAESGTDNATVGTNEAGRATVRFTPLEVGTYTVTLTAPDGDSSVNTVTYEIVATDDAVGTGGDNGSGGGINNGFPIQVFIDSSTPNKCTVELTFVNDRSDDVTATDLRINGFFSQGASGPDISNITVRNGPPMTAVELNGDLTPLETLITVPAQGQTTVELSTDDDFVEGGFLIMEVHYTSTSGSLTDTYFIGVPKKSGGNCPY